MLTHGAWRDKCVYGPANSPLDLYDYAMKCPQWSYYKRAASGASDEGENSDDSGENSDDSEKDQGDKINQYIDALLGFYGLGDYADIRDCALQIERATVN